MNKEWTAYKVILFDLDGTLQRSKSGRLIPTAPDDIELLPHVRERIQEVLQSGIKIGIITNQNSIMERPTSVVQVEMCLAQTEKLLFPNVPSPMERSLLCTVWRCHSFGPDDRRRKPHPAMAHEAFQYFKVTPQDCLYVGDMESDREFAANAGMDFAWAADFFGGGR